MSAERRVPALVIELEGSPQIRLACATESEEQRLRDWLNSRPELVDLIYLALDLRNAAEAA